MSIVWLILLSLMISPALAATSTASHFRRAHLLPRKSSALAQGTSRRIVQISNEPPNGVAVERKMSYIESVNSSIPDPHWRNYNFWQAFIADGKTNFCILFFAVYISYLIYVLF
ncbi:uncharacterized protein LOC110190288 [Drosophila serrata]|uniref:uncharacterized protein LOC110190288 n=1 Tax=Drosophila serrata TaxID=7274 RepID=UPI000A1CFA81|nr:uncharacterized protein LOC110190288 [Drosophila serrata]